MLSALRYELPWFITVALTILLLGTLLIYLLPNIYSVTSEIMIEPERASTDSEGKVTSSDMTQRAHAILKSLMTNENIEKILLKYNLLQEDSDLRSKQIAINQFRDNTRVDFDNVAVINQYTGREGMFSLGLSIKHENESPEMAFQITQELTDQLLSSTRVKTTKEDEQRLVFLENQIKATRVKLEKAEETVAGFKEKNANYLPEVQPLAIRRMEDLQSKLTEISRNLRSLRSNSDELYAELATKKKEVSLYSSDGVRVPGLEEKLLVMKNDYVEKLTRYTKEHPEVKALKQEIRDLEAVIKKGGTKNTANSRMNDPVYSLLLSRAVKVQEEIDQESALKEETSKSLEKINQQLERMPFVEQELQRLQREQEFTAAKYKELETELVRLEIDTGRRDANLLGNFQLLEQPQFPLTPEKPKKKILMVVLFLLAMSSGYLAALIMHMLKDKINSIEDIEALSEHNAYIIPDFSPPRNLKEKISAFVEENISFFRSLLGREPVFATPGSSPVSNQSDHNAMHSNKDYLRQLEARSRYGKPE